MTKTLKSRVSAFIKGAKMNGNSGFTLILDSVDHWRTKNDPVYVARLLKEAAPSDQRQIRMIVGAIVSGANTKLQAADGQQLAFDAKVTADMRELAAQGASFRAYKKTASKPDRAKKTTDEITAEFVRRMIKEGVSEQDALANVRHAYNAAAAEPAH